MVERGIALFERDDVLLGDWREEFAEAPDSALIFILVRILIWPIRRASPIEPERFERLRIETGFRKEKFEQIAACVAAEILRRGNGRHVARDATQAWSGGGVV